MSTHNDAEHWKTFGRWLKQQRLATRRNRKDLAAEAGISDSSWQNYESGGRTVGGTGHWIVQRPSTESLIGIARALQIPPKTIFAKAKVTPDFPLPAEVEPLTMLKTTTPEAADAINALKESMREMMDQMNELRAQIAEIAEPAENPAPRGGRRR